MRTERKTTFTPKEEQRINCATSSLLEQGEGAVDRLRVTRLSHSSLETAILQRGGSVQDAHAAGGRTVELADEAIKRAQKGLEERGKDRAIQMREIAGKINK